MGRYGQPTRGCQMKRWVQGIITGVAILTAAGCTPTPSPSGGVSAGCVFAPDQTSNELRMNCTITGTPANVLIDPINPENRACGLTSFSLYDQALTAPATFIWGEGGDDGQYRVRIGVVIGTSNHTAHLAKSSGLSCESIIGPVVNLATAFSGRHTALIDKGQIPMCVFQSLYTGATFTQTGTENLTGVGGDLSFATQKATEEAIAQQLDLEAARAVNRLLGYGSSLDAAFDGRSGRCPNDYRPFDGN